jgi:predicted ferric reductase
VSSLGVVGVPAQRRIPRRRPRAVDGLAALAGAGFGAVVAQWVVTMPSLTGGAPNVLLAGAQFAGLAGAYLALVGLLLAARVPVLDSTVGLDRLIAVHARLGRWTLLLMVAHGLAVTLAYAALARTGPLAQFWLLVTQYEWVLPAAAGLGLMVIAGVGSWWRARRLMRYETWWTLHLIMYVGLALAIPHQIVNGAAFVGHPVAQALWLALIVLTFGCLLAFRMGLPLIRALRHRLRVVDVVEEAPDVVSVIIAGVRMDRLPIAGGQFAHWRFLTRGLAWPSHPYSISGILPGGRLRITVRTSGDHGGLLRRVRPGTPVVMEGPYGAFTAHARHNGCPVTLVAAGIGITPIRSLLDDLPTESAPTVLHRAHRQDDLILGDEMDMLVHARGGVLHRLVGHRDRQPINAQRLAELVPGIEGHELYVCGPPGFAAAVLAAARHLGIPRHRVHAESFRLHPVESRPGRTATE